MTQPAPDLEQALQNQIDKIGEAILQTRQNRIVDIGDMDEAVAMICQKIIHSSGDTIKALEPKMIAMIAKLDELAVELKDYQNRVGS